MLVEILGANSWLVALGLNSGLLVIALMLPKKLLTLAGYFHAWILGVVVWGTLSWAGYTVVMFYFLVGSGLTRVGKATKEAAGIAEKRGGLRGPENVWGSALTGTVCALGTLLVLPENNQGALWLGLLSLGYVASFATKLSDTTASEIGKAYGKRTFLITNFKPVPAGTEGAVSLEGTVAGVVASLVIAFVGWAVGLVTLGGILLCAIAAFVATYFESVIGATLQSRYGWLTNEVVNGINTTIGALVAIGLCAAWIAIVS
ncbi:MAG: TIGR00297 family protein [Cyanobacteria bacterium P01_H01_bin.15]